MPIASAKPNVATWTFKWKTEYTLQICAAQYVCGDIVVLKIILSHITISSFESTT